MIPNAGVVARADTEVTDETMFVRMTRSGNRQLNGAMHRIAVTQIRMAGYWPAGSP